MEPGTAFGVFVGILSSLATNYQKHLWLRGAFCSRGHTSKYDVVQSCTVLGIKVFHWTIPKKFPSLGSKHGAEVHEVRWWMCHFKAPTPKRHVGFSNSKTIKKIDKGKLQGWKPANKTVTVQHYIDGKGKCRYKGTASLRATEILDTYMLILIIQMWKLSYAVLPIFSWSIFWWHQKSLSKVISRAVWNRMWTKFINFLDMQNAIN